MNNNDINYYKNELEIKKVQVSDLENELNLLKKELEDVKNLNDLQKKHIEEYKEIEETRALKFNNMKNKLGPFYGVLLRIKKIVEK